MEPDSESADSARYLLWAKQHGPVVALGLYILLEGGIASNLIGVIC
jgi:hypothetical protein